jgi:hypothetical protein
LSVYNPLITPPLFLTVFRLEQNMVVHYYKPITIESLNFVLVQLNQTNEDPSIPTFSCLSCDLELVLAIFSAPAVAVPIFIYFGLYRSGIRYMSF